MEKYLSGGLAAVEILQAVGWEQEEGAGTGQLLSDDVKEALSG